MYSRGEHGFLEQRGALRKSVDIKHRITSNRYLKEFLRDKFLLAMLIPMVVYLIVFSYIPMYGIAIAFQNYSIGDKFISFSGRTHWVGLKYFIDFFRSIFFFRVFKNSIILGLLWIGFAFWIPIVFALLLNEVRNKPYKRVVQTLSYLPHFISTVIIVGIVKNFLTESDGVINNLVEVLGGTRIPFLNRPEYFRPIYIGSGIWQSFGWSTIIYLAAIAGVDLNLYEAAKMDGAGRWKQALYITIPGMAPTIVLLLILSIGSLLSADFEKILLLYNAATYSTADVIGTYTYRTGLVDARYSYGAAIGLFSTVVNFLLLTLSNRVSRKVSDFSLW